MTATGLRLYDRTAAALAAGVIERYSTSFSLACRLLGARVRTHVRVIYALVRIADEIVDGPAAEAGLDARATGRLLQELREETHRGIDRGFSSNLVVHAFAMTARECGIGGDLIDPFFDSMATDLGTSDHDGRSRERYVYGSAEVVGLMCLQVFVNAGRPGVRAPHPVLVDGARRLGSAFQEINFLRDAEHDRTSLGRDYLGLSVSASARSDALARIDADLSAAERSLRLLPPDSRTAVRVAHDLFAELARELRDASPTTRVRVGNGRKALIAARASLRTGIADRTRGPRPPRAQETQA